jgi:hypothetical protein
LIVGFLDSKVATASFRAEVSDGDDPQVETEIVVTASAATEDGATETAKASARRPAPIETFFIFLLS